ncbi:MAG: DEAD/DEAH box helicase family protein [Clostridium sp.]
METIKSTGVNSKAEDLFVQLFCETFGPDKTENLQIQYPCVDIYGNHRFIDFALESPDMKIAIEIDGETYHNPNKVSENKYYDDLLKQNSLIFDDWKVYRWVYNQLNKQPDKVKDELVTFMGASPLFKEFETSLPSQLGQAIELRDYQQEAIDSLQAMRNQGETIALLYHATGVGKTITAATDARAIGGRTLFLVNALKLADQAKDTFAKVWTEATQGTFTGSSKEITQQVIFATVQSISKSLTAFTPKAFDYIVVDECHHAAAKTYQKVFSYFHPKFILGLTATPERTDGEDMLELFQNVAHRMDLKTAVEREILAPIRCIRVKTDIDLSDVRINGIKYNAQDLESKMFIPERNQLIVDTYLKYVSGFKTVIFCASVDHAEKISEMLCERGVKAESISGRDKPEVRNCILDGYEHGNINVLCACDLLNEGWDSPHTTVLFMARPTMSKTIYMQQLGRGTRKCEGKKDLLVFDFVDNANMFNQAYSLHRLLDIAQYQPLGYVLAPESGWKLDHNMLYKGEKPTVYLDMPIDVDDFETIDLFNWQNTVKDMISQIEFVRMVDVQSETVDKYVRTGKIKPDLAVPIGEKRFFNYYTEDSVHAIANQFHWDLITDSNMAEKFMKFIETMDMSFSYKPVLIKAMFDYVDMNGKVRIEDIVDYFINFYEMRKEAGLVAEQDSSIYQKGGYSKKDVEKNILANPFKRFADMRFFRKCKDITQLEINPAVFKKLSAEDVAHIRLICDECLQNYYARIAK